MAVVLITHDLGVIAQAAEKVAVMYAGKIVESSTVEEIFAHPLHPYTQGLLESIPARCVDSMEKGDYLKTIPGSVPNLYNIALGCRFYERCSYADEECSGKEPQLMEIQPDHFVSCWKCSAKKKN
jgi:oligopeptide/dipeptide ABC transporter ATP-binding protein